MAVLGDIVKINGVIFTARDMVHKYLFEGGNLPLSLENQIIYHCGPIVVKDNGTWVVKAAGPTTSLRFEPYMWKIINEHKIKSIIGKGGMGEKTRGAIKKSGCYYYTAVGGAAVFIAEKIKKVRNVYLLDKFGPTEAVWELEVEDLPVILTIDPSGSSLHEKILKESRII